ELRFHLEREVDKRTLRAQGRRSPSPSPLGFDEGDHLGSNGSSVRNMKTLIIGMGALGGLIAARLRAAGLRVWLATRDAEQAEKLRVTGLRVTGMGGAVTVQATNIAPLDAYGADDKFEFVLLATKAHDAIEAAPKLSLLLGPNATLLPIQNGGVPQMLAERL